MIHGRIARKRTAAKRTGCRHRIAGALKLVLMPDVVTTFLTSDPLSRTAGLATLTPSPPWVPGIAAIKHIQMAPVRSSAAVTSRTSSLSFMFFE